MIDGHVLLLVMVPLALLLYVAIRATEAHEHITAAIAELPPRRISPHLIGVVCGECGAKLPSVDTFAMALLEDEQHALVCPARTPVMEGSS